MADSLHHFTLEKSAVSANGPWSPVDMNISPLLRKKDDSSTVQSGETLYYKLTGFTALGLEIPYNVVSISGPANPDSGTCLLQRMFGGVTSNGGSTTRRIKIDSQGNIIIAGQQNQNVNYGSVSSVPSIGTGGAAPSSDAFVAKYSPAGTLLWVKRFGSVSSDNVSGLAIDSLDHIIVTGSIRGNLFAGPLDVTIGPPDTVFSTEAYGTSDVFVAKFDSDGTLLNFKLFGGTGTDIGTGVAVDSSDNIYLCGTYGFFGTGIDFGGGALSTFGTNAAKVFMAKLDTNFGFGWQKGFSGTDIVASKDIIVSGSSVYMAGSFNGTANFGSGSLVSEGGEDVFIGKYSASDGSNTFVKVISGTASQTVERIAVNSSGDFFACGNFTGTINFGGGHTFVGEAGGNIYAVKYSSSGTYAWSRGFTSPDVPPFASGIAVNSSGDAYVVGELTTGMDFGFGFDLPLGKVFFLLKLSGSTGASVWVRQAKPFSNAGSAVTAAGGYIYASGDSGANNPIQLQAVQTISTAGTGNNNFWLKFVA